MQSRRYIQLSIFSLELPNSFQRGYVKLILPFAVYNHILDSIWHCKNFLNSASLMSVKLYLMCFLLLVTALLKYNWHMSKLHKSIKLDVLTFVYLYEIITIVKIVNMAVIPSLPQIFSCLSIISPSCFSSCPFYLQLTLYTHITYSIRIWYIRILYKHSSISLFQALCIIYSHTFYFYICSKPHNTLLWFWFYIVSYLLK